MWDMLILKMHHVCGIQASLGAPRHPAALAMGGGVRARTTYRKDKNKSVPSHLQGLSQWYKEHKEAL